MEIDTKTLLKRLWKSNRVNFIVGLYNLALLYVSSKVRLGRVLTPLLHLGKKGLDTTANVKKIKESLYRPVEYSFSIFNVTKDEDLLRYYPDLLHAKTFITSGVRVVLGIDDDDDVLNVIVRGSASIENWIENLNADFQYDSTLHSLVHDGYYEIAVDIVKQVSEYYETLLHLQEITQDNPIVVQGYSMGGGLAILAGIHLDKGNLNVKHIYSIAGPRVVELDYGYLPVTHLFNVEDPVPYLPTWSFFTPYRHQGRRVLIMPDDEFMVFKDSLWTDLYTSIWTMRYRIDFKSHTKYPMYF